MAPAAIGHHRVGRRGLVNVAGRAVLVSTLTEDEEFALPPGSTPAPPPNWPSDTAKVIGVDDPPSGPCALVALGKRAAVASAAPAGGVVIGAPSSLPVAYLATGPGAIAALAALIASRELKPPLAIGLFGDWGSGKSFVLSRIEAMITKLTGDGAPDGYLKHVCPIPFNAWHYAETNLWASLVDQVIQTIAPGQSVSDVQEVSEVARFSFTPSTTTP